MNRRGEGLSGLGDESAESLYALSAVVRVEGRRDPGFEPPVPRASRGNEPRCGVGAENLIEVQECPEDGWLVVVEVGTRQVVIKVGAEQFGIRCSAERREGDAVRRTRVRPPLASRSRPMRSRNSVLWATATSQAAVLRSRQPPSKRMPSSAGVISCAACARSRRNMERSAAFIRWRLPPNRRYRRSGLTNRRTSSCNSGSLRTSRMTAS